MRISDKQLAEIEKQLIAHGYHPDRIRIAMRQYAKGHYGMARKALNRTICGARKKDGHLCMASPEADRTRCRHHGGWSTGPKTTEGKRRSGDNLRRWHEQQRERRKRELLGLE